MYGSESFGLSQSISQLHVFGNERLQAFSDAVFSIIATLMVIPLKLEREEVRKYGGIEEFQLQKFMLYHWYRYLIYLYSFTLVVDTWYSHVGIFSIVEQVDDVIIWMNLLCLLLVSFLPFGTGLVSSYPESNERESLAITICSLDLMLIGICMVLILLYAFRQQSLLHPEIEKNQNIKSIRRAFVISVLITPSLALLALGFSFLTSVPIISMVLFYSIGAASFITRLAFYWYYKFKKKIDKLPIYMFRAVASNYRTETFSDGLFAIVATLIILDLTTSNIPDPDDVKKNFDGSLYKALNAQRNVFGAYITSFVIVGLLWFIHYSMMHFIEKMTPSLSIVNMSTLFLIGGIPFVSGIYTIFSDKSSYDDDNGFDSNKAIALRTLSVLLFLASVGQLLFWTLALFQKDSCMTKDINKRKSEALQFSKIMVFPVVSFIVFWCTFSETFLHYHIYDYVMSSTPFIFLVLKALFRKHDLAMKRIKQKMAHVINRNRNGGERVNNTVDERTTLIRKKDEEAVRKLPVITAYPRVVSKEEEPDIELKSENYNPC